MALSPRTECPHIFVLCNNKQQQRCQNIPDVNNKTLKPFDSHFKWAAVRLTLQNAVCYLFSTAAHSDHREAVKVQMEFFMLSSVPLVKLIQISLLSWKKQKVNKKIQDDVTINMFDHIPPPHTHTLPIKNSLCLFLQSIKEYVRLLD